MAELILFFLAGVVGGVVNSAAGGAKLFVFPMLVAAGLSPLAAAATSAVALWPAQVPAIWVHRKGLFDAPGALLRQTFPALIGALLGAFALVLSSEAGFLAVVPVLLLIAVGAILMGRRLTTVMQRLFPGDRLRKATSVLLFAVGVYGGYFGAGMGFMLIAVFSVAAGVTLQKANTLKNLTAVAISTVAVVPISLSGLVEWHAAGTVLVGGLIGGVFGGYITKWVPEAPMRIGVAVVGLVLVASYLLT